MALLLPDLDLQKDLLPASADEELLRFWSFLSYLLLLLSEEVLEELQLLREMEERGIFQVELNFVRRHRKLLKAAHYFLQLECLVCRIFFHAEFQFCSGLKQLFFQLDWKSFLFFERQIFLFLFVCFEYFVRQFFSGLIFFQNRFLCLKLVFLFFLKDFGFAHFFLIEFELIFLVFL